MLKISKQACMIVIDVTHNLMNHRRDVHPSRRKCQNFPASCAWGNTCWYKHEEPMEIDSIPEENKWNFKCDLCEETFINCKDFLFHKKKKHSSTILQCEKFLKGECSSADDMCWFKHSRTSNDKAHVFGSKSPSKNQIFRKLLKHLCPQIKQKRYFKS